MFSAAFENANGQGDNMEVSQIYRRSFVLFLVGAGLIASGTGRVEAQTAEDFFKKTQINLIVSSSPGGGYDHFGRLVTQYMSKYLPGNPNIVVQNMPGAGGLRTMNYLYSVAPKDGSTLAIVQRGVLTAKLLYGEKSQVTFDPSQFLWLGSVAREMGVGLVSTNTPVKTIEDATKLDLSFGASGTENDGALYARLTNKLFSTRIKTIAGYPGQTEYYLAMERGETDGLFMSGWSGPNTVRARRSIAEGTVRAFVQIRDQRLKEFSEVPTILESVTNEADRQVIKVILARLQLGLPFLVPPEVPADRLKILQEAFRKAVSDPEFIEKVQQQGDVVDPIFAEEATQIMKSVFATPPDVIARLQELVKSE
jgi:tripartite-type tricarboxylate transporter receptor subunit TctC